MILGFAFGRAWDHRDAEKFLRGGGGATRLLLFFLRTVKLIEQKLEARFGMTESERSFFGGPRQFKRNVLCQLRPKEMP